MYIKNMNNVPLGSLQTLNVLSSKLAKIYKVDYCCTLTTGIQVNIAANASVELDERLPFWRTIKNDGGLNQKYPGGVEKHRDKLREEGFYFIQKGRKNIRYVIADYEKYL